MGLFWVLINPMEDYSPEYAQAGVCGNMCVKAQSNRVQQVNILNAHFDTYLNMSCITILPLKNTDF